jgi:hypothetical protein
MKKQLSNIYVPLVIMLVVTLGAFPVAYAAKPTAQAQVTAFIENVLPIDLSKYTVTLKNNASIDRLTDTVQYTLDSDKSTVDVICFVQNHVVSYCHLYSEKGQVISDKQYNSPIDAAKDFLNKYQTYTKADSSNMIDMLDNVDATKDSSRTIGNTNFTVSNIDKHGVELTIFKWVHTVNGAEYTSLQVGFRKNGILEFIIDNRAVYSIGDTTVNISREQAIDIAMKRSETYSYDMGNGFEVSGFNITEDRTTAKLVAYPINSTVLRPYWHIELFLNQTYPGSVHGLTIYVWANSGEAFHCSNIAYGGAEYSQIDNTSSSASSENRTAAIVAIVAMVAVIAASALFIKKRGK